ncbi:hypothetical protein O6H91_08G095800 [Diphasiastrum complanatum]|uniref:Uncharacterized protein n=2 Tax=Diphasiastrum complanatum TaxID=34168 RepID=A0ACC2D0D5_DIPCM|nr:hypothetical protein O6H91_08G095800 [Diphasiastrum complanatum]KAJ7547629.1 hypothetical protein O6H91_08G095800 [Diphasiastrum complanatum]
MLSDNNIDHRLPPEEAESMGKALRNGADQTEGAFWESIKSKACHRKINSKSMQMTAGLTCLQLLFAIYATFLLYFMSPSIDLSTGSASISWASQIARQWQNLLFKTSPTDESITPVVTKQGVCEFEEIGFDQKKSNDTRMIGLKTDLFREILHFQHRTRGCETLPELMNLPSTSTNQTKITVILNHFKRKTLCAQLDSLLQQTLPFYNVWVLAFGSPLENSLRQIVNAYNHSRIHFVGSTYDFKYYGRFQMALQAEGADYVYILDDDMIPGRKMLQILAHAAGTEKHHNAVLGSIGRVLPFRQKDFSFPSYRKFRSKEAGIYLPDPAYGIVVDRVVQVDFLSSGWFMSAELVKTLFIETPFTFETGEDLHLSYQLQKYRDAGSFVVPVDPRDKDTWGDSEHRLAYVSETTVIHKNIVEIRDDQWWRSFSRGYVTQWAAMYPQESDVFFYAHSLGQILDLAPLILRFRSTYPKKAFVVVSGGSHCPCEDAAAMLGWTPSSCHDRRFKIFDLELGSVARTGNSDVQMTSTIAVSMKGLIKIHSPALIITVADIAAPVRDALALASKTGNVSLVQIPRTAIRHALWMADIKTSTLRQWNKMRISVNIITQNRPQSLQRLLNSLLNAHYLGDEIELTFNMDNQVDAKTLEMVDSMNWPHGRKILRRRIVQAGLIRAVSESWYPATDDDFGLLLEDDIEVSPFYYMWLKYALLAYHYDAIIPELTAIALYTPRLIEVVKERPKWNATDFFKTIHPNIPYLHQLPCSWGALFFPKHWREFYKYMGMRYTANAKENPVQIPRSRTNGWQASWKKYLIDMMYLRGYVTLYPNFPNQTSFSTNHMEPGAHINASENTLNHKREDFTVPLMQENFWEQLPQQKLPPASKLPVLNLFNQAISLKELKVAGAKLGQDVLSCNQAQTVTVHNITGEPLACSTF